MNNEIPRTRRHSSIGDSENEHDVRHVVPFGVLPYNVNVEILLPMLPQHCLYECIKCDIDQSQNVWLVAEHHYLDALFAHRLVLRK
jgi:hypothetical protein